MKKIITIAAAMLALAVGSASAAIISVDFAHSDTNVFGVGNNIGPLASSSSLSELMLRFGTNF